jgi:hypothetical protein
MAARDLIFLRDLLYELNILLNAASPVFSDSRSAVLMAFDPVAFKKTKHILRAAGEEGGLAKAVQRKVGRRRSTSISVLKAPIAPSSMRWRWREIVASYAAISDGRSGDKAPGRLVVPFTAPKRLAMGDWKAPAAPAAADTAVERRPERRW